MDLCAEEGRGIGTRLFRWAERQGGEYLWTTSPSFFRPLGWRVHSLWEGRHIMVPGWSRLCVSNPGALPFEDSWEDLRNTSKIHHIC